MNKSIILSLFLTFSSQLLAEPGEGGNSIKLPNGKFTYEQELCNYGTKELKDIASTIDFEEYNKRLSVLEKFHPMVHKDIINEKKQNLICITDRKLGELLGVPEDAGRYSIFLSSSVDQNSYVIVNESFFTKLTEEEISKELFFKQLYRYVSLNSSLEAKISAEKTMQTINRFINLGLTKENFKKFHISLRETSFIPFNKLSVSSLPISNIIELIQLSEGNINLDIKGGYYSSSIDEIFFIYRYNVDPTCKTNQSDKDCLEEYLSEQSILLNLVAKYNIKVNMDRKASEAFISSFTSLVRHDNIDLDIIEKMKLNPRGDVAPSQVSYREEGALTYNEIFEQAGSKIGHLVNLDKSCFEGGWACKMRPELDSGLNVYAYFALSAYENLIDMGYVYPSQPANLTEWSAKLKNKSFKDNLILRAIMGSKFEHNFFDNYNISKKEMQGYYYQLAEYMTQKYYGISAQEYFMKNYL